MGQTDLAVRLLAEHHMSALAPSLLEGRRVEVLAVERSELQLVERITDQVVRARVDGVETILHVEFQARHSAPQLHPGAPRRGARTGARTSPSGCWPTTPCCCTGTARCP